MFYYFENQIFIYDLNPTDPTTSPSNNIKLSTYARPRVGIELYLGT